MIARSIDHRLFKDVSDTEGGDEDGDAEGEKEREREREEERGGPGGCNFRELRRRKKEGRKEGRKEGARSRSLAGAPTEQRTPLTTDRPSDVRGRRTTKTCTERAECFGPMEIVECTIMYLQCCDKNLPV